MLAGVGFESAGADVVAGRSRIQMREVLSALGAAGVKRLRVARCRRRVCEAGPVSGQTVGRLWSQYLELRQQQAALG